MEPQLNQEVLKTAAAHDGPIETDAVIVGAGPVGLFQVFELGLLEIKAHVIDSLAYPGGQCVELYPDKPIYDIPAVPVCTGQELTDNLLKQIEPFGATFHFGQEVTVVERQDDGRFYVETSRGTKFLTRTIFIAAGVGAVASGAVLALRRRWPPDTSPHTDRRVTVGLTLAAFVAGVVGGAQAAELHEWRAGSHAATSPRSTDAGSSLRIRAVPTSTARAPVQRRTAPDSSWATLPADRSFKVLQPSRSPAQLSLFPEPWPIVVPSGSCGGMVAKHYPELFQGDPNWSKRAATAPTRAEATPIRCAAGTTATQCRRPPGRQ
mgnify:CR=1 FL=1